MAIALRGTAKASAPLNGADVTLTFDTGAGAPHSGDIIIVVGGGFNRSGWTPGPTSGQGYTNIILHTDALPFTSLDYKVSDGTETTVVCKGTGNTSDANAYGAIVLSGVDAAIFDATTVQNGPTASTNPDPAAITTVTGNAMVLAMAVSTSNDGSPGTVTNYTVQASAGGNDTNDASVSIATRIIVTPASENPPAWSAWTTGTWRGFTVALKPGPVSPTSADGGKAADSVAVRWPKSATDGGKAADVGHFAVNFFLDAEAAIATDAASSAIGAAGSVGTDGAKAADTVTLVHTQRPAATDGAKATDAATGTIAGGGVAVSGTEVGVLTDTASARVTHHASASDSGIGHDDLTGSLLDFGLPTEVAKTTDAANTHRITRVAASDGARGADAASVKRIVRLTSVDGSKASNVSSSSISPASPSTDRGIAHDTVSSRSVQRPAIADGGRVSDAATATVPGAGGSGKERFAGRNRGDWIRRR